MWLINFGSKMMSIFDQTSGSQRVLPDIDKGPVCFVDAENQPSCSEHENKEMVAPSSIAFQTEGQHNSFFFVFLFIQWKRNVWFGCPASETLSFQTSAAQQINMPGIKNAEEKERISQVSSSG